MNSSVIFHDSLKRPLRDLRISVTDRCNFRCTYCMPREVFGANHVFLPRKELLTFDEIIKFASIAVNNGVQKIRITGGEPLMRRNLEELISMLAQLKTPEGNSIDLTLTTNGALLANKAQALKQAGLNRITVSLDALDPNIFERMSDSKVVVQSVLDNIEIASQAGLNPVKVNMVVRKGVNDQQILPMARYFRDAGHTLRFIEFMDVGATNGWNMQQVVTGAEIIDTLSQEFKLEPVQSTYRGEVAKEWRYTDKPDTKIGIITSVSQPFCGDCTRLRLSPEGKIFLCLFASAGFDVRELLRSNASDEEIKDRISTIWAARSDRYSEIRGEQTVKNKKIEMSYIGG